jgi:hypothetical protein
MQQLNAQIDVIEGYVLARCQDSEPYRLITTIPGIGTILGMTILLETGPIERFAKVGGTTPRMRVVSPRIRSATANDHLDPDR